jgi:hypothetical protein
MNLPKVSACQPAATGRQPALSWMLPMALLLCFPGEALALQVHGEPEGLYVHQMAHLHFIFALGYLFLDIRRTGFSGKGWLFLQFFCGAMVLWNLVAFIGHQTEVLITADQFANSEDYLRMRLLGPLSLHKIIYYLTKMDHLVIVPGLLLLFLAMRSFYKSIENEPTGRKK